jgi:Tat protein translocase TatB subunit
VFNLHGGEIIFILLIALVVLGPEKLPGAVRRATRTYAELRKMGDNFQSEFKAVLDEPMREMRETADLIKDNADPKKVAERAEREAHAAAEAAAAAKRAELAAAALVSDEDASTDEHQRPDAGESRMELDSDLEPSPESALEPSPESALETETDTETTTETDDDVDVHDADHADVDADVDSAAGAEVDGEVDTDDDTDDDRYRAATA